MSTILVRCSVHGGLSQATFSEWLERRRGELGAVGRLSAIDARWLDHHELVIELQCEAGVGDDSRLGSAVREFIIDLRLLGMSPTVYLPAANALNHPDVEMGASGLAV